MGAGYAYWNDTLTITNTVKTGTFNLEFGNSKYFLDFFGEDYDNYKVVYKFDPPNIVKEIITDSSPFEWDMDVVSITEIERSDDRHTLSFGAKNLYPGSGAWIKFRIVNTGTVPAVVDNIEGILTSGAELKDTFRYTISDIRLVKYSDILNDTEVNPFEPPIHPEQSYSTFDGFIDGLNKKLKNYSDGNRLVLYPGDYLEINGTESGTYQGYDIYFKESSTEKVTLSDGTTALTEQRVGNDCFAFNLKLNYTQWNH